MVLLMIGFQSLIHVKGSSLKAPVPRSGITLVVILVIVVITMTTMMMMIEIK